MCHECCSEMYALYEDMKFCSHSGDSVTSTPRKLMAETTPVVTERLPSLIYNIIYTWLESSQLTFHKIVCVRIIEISGGSPCPKLHDLLFAVHGVKNVEVLP